MDFPFVLYDHERRSDPAEKPVCTYLPPRTEGLEIPMDEYLHRRNLMAWLAWRNGWYPSAEAGDPYPRIVIPATSMDPTNKYWQARALGDIAENVPRYQSPHHVRRGDALIVVWPMRGATHLRAVLVEGPMDALAAAGLGCMGIAMMGRTLPPASRNLFRALVGAAPLSVVMDRDAEEEAARMAREFPGATLHSPYPFKDLAEAPVVWRVRILDLDDPKSQAS